MKYIRFYRLNDEYGYFSNFSNHPIFLEGEVWPTVEHYFQANKFQSVELKSKIKSLSSPMKAANEGRNKRNQLRSDWNDVKLDIMLKALIAKFTQYPELKINLLNTKSAILIEHTEKDFYWGNGGDDSGENMLGLLLMKTRDILLKISQDIDSVLPPWIAFPDIGQHDLFWRMGLGEEYLFKWSKYYFTNNTNQEYMTKFPPTPDWEGIYD